MYQSHDRDPSTKSCWYNCPSSLDITNSRYLQLPGGNYLLNKDCKTNLVPHMSLIDLIF